jgi:prepilin-type N-terminal cleavage/methylation domain-containing protein
MKNDATIYWGKEVNIMKKSKGFTLIELMIVVAIIGILSAIAIPKFADLIRKSNEGATKGNLGAIRSAMSIYYGEMEGWYPTSDPGPIMTMEGGKYIKTVPPSYAPPYHSQSFTFDMSAANGTAEGTTSKGGWSYQQNSTPASTDQQWGNVWVNCTHTDSKNTTWSAY